MSVEGGTSIFYSGPIGPRFYSSNHKTPPALPPKMTTQNLSQEDIHRAKSCTGKRSYSLFEAIARANAAIIASGGSVIEAYKCEFCPSYHIGHARTHIHA